MSEQEIFSSVDVAFARCVQRQLGVENEAYTAFLSALFSHSRNGHLALDVSQLDFPDPQLKQLIESGAKTFPPQAIGHWIFKLNSKFYLQKNWMDETQVVNHLKRLSAHPPSAALSFSKVNSQLNEDQQKAVENAQGSCISLLTGGPGTGKTFTAAEIVKACLESRPRIVLTAPTGKAVAQLEANLKMALGSESSIRSGTLHALLGIKEHRHEEETARILFADLIIVDECSMIDARIFSRLLAAIPSGARLVLIGDKDQLPAIEAGSIFADLLEVGIFPSTFLTKSLRSDRKEILDLSCAVREGNAAKTLEMMEKGTDVQWTEETNLQDLWRIFQERFQFCYSEIPQSDHLLSLLDRFVLLSSIRQGPFGVDALNRYFLSQSLKGLSHGGWWTAPIMITRNDYELEVYNGDLGVLVRRFSDEFSLRQFHLDDYILLRDRKGGVRQIRALSLNSFEYSYSLSVHKSQGSEYDEAIILIPPGSEAFGREVLYTAITRVRHKATLVCSKELFAKILTVSSRKTSGLAERLRRKILTD